LYYYRQSENEKNAFNRLKRIDDLCEFALPFKVAIDELSVHEKGNNVFNNFFFMILFQKMYYLNKKEIKKISTNLKSHELFKGIQKSEIPEQYIGLFNNITEARYLKIRSLNLKTQARHKVAVLIKSILRSIRK
jgi:hypothetical protein